jgi:hypothetical protein
MNLRIRSIIAATFLTLAVIAGAGGPALVEAQKSVSLAGRPFEPAEELFYEAEFSRALLRKLNVAEFKFRASRTPLVASKSPDNSAEPGLYSLTFNAEIASKGFFTRLFNLKFRERVESIVEPISFTVLKTTILDEQGKRVRATEVTFDQAKGRMSWTQHDPNNPSGEPRNIITDFSGQLQDILSAIYFIRTQTLQVGKSFELFIGDGGRVYRVPVQVVEKKTMKTVLGRVNVIRVDPQIFGPNNLVDNEKGQFSLWITDDNRRIPVGGRIKSDYGTFDIKLKRVVTTPPS